MHRAGVAGVVLAAALGGLLASGGPQAQVGRRSAYVELRSPQGDDLGHCMERVPQSFRNRVAGVASVRAGVTAISVNGTPARVRRPVHPALGAPTGWSRCGFEAWLPGPVPDELTVVVTDRAGRVTEAQFRADSQATVARLRELAAEMPKAAMGRYRLGSAFLDRDRNDEAVAEFRRAAQIDPGDALPHGALGALLTRQGNLDEGIAELQRSVELDPEVVSVGASLSAALLARSEYDAAKTELSRAAELEPDDPCIPWLKGMVLAAEGEVEEAGAECRKSVELEPNFLEARVSLAGILTVQDKPEEAAAECEAALKIDPQFVDARVGLATALYRQDEPEGARAECQKAIDTDSNHAEAHVIMGAIMLVQGETDSCIASCRRGLELGSQTGWAHAVLAGGFFRKGRYVEAERRLTIADLHGLDLDAELEQDIHDRARMMRSWIMDGRLTMAAMFLPLLGVLAALGVGSARAGGLDLVPRTLAWRSLLLAAAILTVCLAGVFAAQALFRTGHIGAGSYGWVTHGMAVVAITGGMGLLGLVSAIGGRAAKGIKGPGGVPYYCSECRRTINFWRMYYDGRRTTCADCLAASGSPSVPPPPGPPSPPPIDRETLPPGPEPPRGL